jgi:SAM-dependent methyltransferase
MGNQTNNIRDAVRQNYSKVAENYSVYTGYGCAPDTENGCCVPNSTFTFNQISSRLGYSEEELNNVPEGSNMGLGCGNPQVIAALKKGETVLDLGSGAGFDVFLAANQVGRSGKVIGVDMTPKMITKARKNAKTGNYTNVEFRLGEIENLPVQDRSIDAIISNCVINLSPEKQKVFNDAFRVLISGGRLAVSDVVARTELPEEIKNDLELFSGCVSGASTIDELEMMLKTAGFINIEIKPKDESKKFIREWAPGTKISDYITSAAIEAVKP